MIDNAEWGSGLSAKFGIQHVNYTTLERTYKRSAFSLCKSNLLVYQYPHLLFLQPSSSKLIFSLRIVSDFVRNTLARV